ncbi:hypothetical protein [Kitasatospora purpeofusca]|uniref:hypothetical protein n=1 Tax=Kitasatospora purpeofusca TaxID=67352 RepID=UPI00382DCEC9
MVVHRQWIEGSTIYGSVFQLNDVNGGLTVNQQRPLYKIDAFPLDRRVISTEQARRQPARLLYARHALIDFIGRKQELADLAEWRDGPDGVSVFLIHGPGGQGKSRLAAHFAAASRAKGWQVMQARHATDPTAAVPGKPGTDTAGVLMVADYAERWPVGDLIELIIDAVRQGHRARVLLVARPKGTWWQNLAYRLSEFDLPTSELFVPPLADLENSPESLYAAARARFAEVLAVPGTEDLALPAGLSGDPDYRQVLGVHMAALAAVEAHRRRDEAPDGAAAVSAYLLTRERAHWEALHDNGRVRITADSFAQAVYTAVLTNPLDHRAGLDAVDRIGIGTTEHADQLLKDHAVAYPAATPETVLEPLYPDRLAEDFLALMTAGHNVASFTPDPWTGGAPLRLLSQPSEWQGTAMTVLVAAAARWPHVATRQLAPLLGARPELALAGGGATLAALSEIRQLDEATLSAVEQRLPAGSHPELNAGIVSLVQRLTDIRLPGATAQQERARLLEALAQRQSYAGLHPQALETGLRFMEIRRKLGEQNPSAHGPHFAWSLSDVGVYLAKNGRLDEALTATGQAVRAFRNLVDAGRTEHRDGLATALSNQSADLAQSGRWKEALFAIEEAISIRFQSMGDQPAGGDPSLAAALSNFAVCLARAGRRSEAVDAAQQALAIRRQLVAASPGLHEAGLAASLVNVSARRLEIGHFRSALEEASEAVRIWRELAEVNPVAYEHDLSVALLSLATASFSLGLQNDALAATASAVGLLDTLAARSPGVHEVELALALTVAGTRLFTVGRHHEALRVWERAASIRRHLATTGGTDEAHDLAHLLWTVAWVHMAQSRDLPEMLALIEEAVAIYRWLATGSERFRDELRNATATWARMLSLLGRDEEARDVLRGTNEPSHLSSGRQ